MWWLLWFVEEKLGLFLVLYFWLVCGLQGWQEQIGVSDQDNCFFLDDVVSDVDCIGYFGDLVQFVCDGFNVVGYVYCLGDMMVINLCWCQLLFVWKGYFQGWIDMFDLEVQMFSLVMFDLRFIGGVLLFFENLQVEMFLVVSQNLIFVVYMISNFLKYVLFFGFLWGLVIIWLGENKNMLELKYNGVDLIVDLGCIYVLWGQIGVVNICVWLEEVQKLG